MLRDLTNAPATAQTHNVEVEDLLETAKSVRVPKVAPRPAPVALELNEDDEATMEGLRRAALEDVGVEGPDTDELVPDDSGFTEPAAKDSRVSQLADPTARFTGVCCLSNTDKGYAFIKPTSGGSDLYTPRDSVSVQYLAEAEDGSELDPAAAHPAMLTLCVGETVEYSVTANPAPSAKRPLKAVNVTAVGGGPVRVQDPRYRRRGVICYWTPEKKYGFISPHHGGADLFFHGAAVVLAPGFDCSSVAVGMVVEYTPTPNRMRGREIALGVTDANFKPIEPSAVPTSAAVVQQRNERKRRRQEEDKAAEVHTRFESRGRECCSQLRVCNSPVAGRRRWLRDGSRPSGRGIRNMVKEWKETGLAKVPYCAVVDFGFFSRVILRIFVIKKVKRAQKEASKKERV